MKGLLPLAFVLLLPLQKIAVFKIISALAETLLLLSRWLHRVLYVIFLAVIIPLGFCTQVVEVFFADGLTLYLLFLSRARKKYL